MFILACLIGIYSYGIFALGIFGILTKSNISVFTISWLIIAILFSALNIRNYLGFRISNLELKSKILLTFLIAQLLVNLVGALGPELGFDALWYHLTQPKIWLQEGVIRYIPGNIFRYSLTPQLTETLYTVALAFGNQIWAKLIHFSFGILSLIVTYNIARKFFPINQSLIAVLLLSSNLVFSWLQTTSYIDLSRTFFESLALLLFLEKKYTPSAITLGLAICSKLISLASLPIFLILFFISQINPIYHIRYTIYTLLIPLPWLLFAYFQTGNPLYPIGSLDLAMPISWNLLDLWNLFTHAADPISPIYVITAPLIFFTNFKKWNRGEHLITAYVLLALFFWFVFPHTGGSRYFLPYLPALSVLTMIVYSKLKDVFIRNVLIFITLILSFTSIFYRAVANSRYLPVIFGTQSKADFLEQNLNFSFGDYCDFDQIINPAHKVYPVGINNLFYIDADLILPPHPFDDASLLLVRYTDSSFTPPPNWQIIHQNNFTHTRIYSKK